jgi:hypothetical protein
MKVNHAQRSVTRKTPTVIAKERSDCGNLRAYPNNPVYSGWLQSPMPALSAKNVLSVEQTTPLSVFGLPSWPRAFRSAS